MIHTFWYTHSDTHILIHIHTNSDTHILISIYVYINIHTLIWYTHSDIHVSLLYTSNLNSCSQSHSDTQSNRAALKFKSQDSPVHTVHCEAEVFEGCLAVLCVARVACVALLACVMMDLAMCCLQSRPARNPVQRCMQVFWVRHACLWWAALWIACLFWIALWNAGSLSKLRSELHSAMICSCNYFALHLWLIIPGFL